MTEEEFYNSIPDELKEELTAYWVNLPNMTAQEKKKPFKEFQKNTASNQRLF